MHDVTEVHERRSGHKDDLQGPEADVGNGERLIIAHIGTSRLFGIAHHFTLLVPPHFLRPSSDDHDPEDEEHGHPYLPDDSGV